MNTQREKTISRMLTKTREDTNLLSATKISNAYSIGYECQREYRFSFGQALESFVKMHMGLSYQQWAIIDKDSAHTLIEAFENGYAAAEGNCVNGY